MVKKLHFGEKNLSVQRKEIDMLVCVNFFFCYWLKERKKLNKSSKKFIFFN